MNWQRDQAEQRRRYKKERQRFRFHRRASDTYKASASKDPLGLYQVLGLSGQESTATQEGIKRAYRRMAVSCHPDLEKDPRKKDEAKKKFQTLTQAYMALKDPSKRAHYDTYGSLP